MTPDMINGVMELGGAGFTWMNAWRLHKERRVAGVFWPAWIWFTVWGWWNVAYYHLLDQPFSWVAGIFLVIGNTVWVAMAARLWWSRRQTQ